MRVDFIGHASLLVSSGGTRLLTDPWWRGPAYHDQWYPYPFPAPERHDLAGLDGLYLSHGHEDHLHAPTLADVPRAATVIIPRSFDPGNAAYVRELGFQRVVEVPGGDSTTLGSLSLTLFTALGDSILVVDDGREVLANVNDALHYAREDVIDAYCRVLSARFPRIDYLFCGYGGASWFPNCFRVPGKDDLAVAERRERLFLSNFARIAGRLAPRHAFPFAAHFVLPDERQWWISEQRLRMPTAREIIAPLLDGTRTIVHDLLPGDRIEDGRIHHAGPREAPLPVEEVRARVLARYPTSPRPARIDAEAFAALLEHARRNAAARRPVGQPLVAAVTLLDHPDEGLLVRTGAGRVTVDRAPPDRLRAAAPDVSLETRSDLLEAALASEYGADQICIGYGAVVRMASRAAVRANAHDRLLKLLSPSGSWRDRLLRHPLSCATYLARDPAARQAVLRRLRRDERRGSYALDDWA